MNSLFRAAALLPALAAAPQVFATCGSAFCTVNTSWDTHGAWAEPGLRLDLRYERINQDQPRAGRSKIAVGEIAREHDEVSTQNRNWLASLDYTFNADWGLNAALPVVGRDHLHVENDFDNGTHATESWKFTSVGDLRVLGRYRLASFEGKEPSLHTAGLNFGLKLATGRFNVRNSEGVLAERTLQPGSGTTDALLGAYFAQLLPMKDLSWFMQGLAQLPLDARDEYRPGRRLSLDAGLRYEASARVGLLLQLNALYRGRDSGVNAEPGDSGGRSWFLSPGVSVQMIKNTRVYGLLQLPLHQYVNGVQLTANRAVVVGLSARF